MCRCLLSWEQLAKVLAKYDREVVVLFVNVERSNQAATINLNYKRVFDSSISKLSALVSITFTILSMTSWR